MTGRHGAVSVRLDHPGTLLEDESVSLRSRAQEASFRGQEEPPFCKPGCFGGCGFKQGNLKTCKRHKARAAVHSCRQTLHRCQALDSK